MVGGKDLPSIATLNDGTEVAGKMTGGRIYARTYANETQAEKAAAWWRSYGFPEARVIHPGRGRVRYVVLNVTRPLEVKEEA